MTALMEGVIRERERENWEHEDEENGNFLPLEHLLHSLVPKFPLPLPLHLSTPLRQARSKIKI